MRAATSGRDRPPAEAHALAQPEPRGERLVTAALVPVADELELEGAPPPRELRGRLQQPRHALHRREPADEEEPRLRADRGGSRVEQLRVHRVRHDAEPRVDPVCLDRLTQALRHRRHDLRAAEGDPGEQQVGARGQAAREQRVVLAHHDRPAHQPAEHDGHGAHPEDVRVDQVRSRQRPQPARASASDSHSFRSGPWAARTRTVRSPSSVGDRHVRPPPRRRVGRLEHQHRDVVVGGDRERLVAHEHPGNRVRRDRGTRSGA